MFWACICFFVEIGFALEVLGSVGCCISWGDCCMLKLEYLVTGAVVEVYVDIACWLFVGMMLAWGCVCVSLPLRVVLYGLVV